MTKQHIADTMHAICPCTSKAHALDMVGLVVEAITQGLAKGEKVTIQGFGSFEVRDMPERVARNPKTGEAVKVPACKKPIFKVASALKSKVNA